MDKQFNKLTKNIQALTTQAYNDYKPLVDGIFANQLTNQKEIENILGYILDFCYDPKMLQLYKSLCRYYWDINPIKDFSEENREVDKYKTLYKVFITMQSPLIFKPDTLFHGINSG